MEEDRIDRLTAVDSAELHILELRGLSLLVSSVIDDIAVNGAPNDGRALDGAKLFLMAEFSRIADGLQAAVDIMDYRSTAVDGDMVPGEVSARYARMDPEKLARLHEYAVELSECPKYAAAGE